MNQITEKKKATDVQSEALPAVNSSIDRRLEEFRRAREDAKQMAASSQQSSSHIISANDRENRNLNHEESKSARGLSSDAVRSNNNNRGQQNSELPMFSTGAANDGM